VEERRGEGGWLLSRRNASLRIEVDVVVSVWCVVKFLKLIEINERVVDIKRVIVDLG